MAVRSLQKRKVAVHGGSEKVGSAAARGGRRWSAAAVHSGCARKRRGRWETSGKKLAGFSGSCSQNPLKYRPSLPLIRLIVSSLRDWHWSWAEGNDINGTHKADIARLRRIASLPCQLPEAKALLLSQMEDVGGIAVPAARGKSAASVADGISRAEAAAKSQASICP